MAMSFSRPDPASPAAVADASFGTGRRGFDQGEVRDFLRMVAAELGRLQERERFLERELRDAQSNPDLNAVELDDAALTRLLGEETARVLTTARASANEIRDKAEKSGAQLLMEASDEAARVREEADIEAARRRADAAADAEAELEMAKQQGREMVNEARAYRERVLSELARRRELAREQIEQLVHGRDRLTQAFERARLVAVDVVAELEPLGEPNEYVNLSPTTGPVPVMVVNEQPADTASDADPGADADIESVTDEPETVEPDIETTDAREPIESSDEPDTADQHDPTDAASETVDAASETIGTVVELEIVEEEPADDDPVDGDSVDGDSAVNDSVDGDSVDGDSVRDTAADDDDEDDADERPAAGDRDEVVVDLFARLRADATNADEPERPNDTGDTDRGEADSGETGVGSATLVGDLIESGLTEPDGPDDVAGSTDADAEPEVDENSPFRLRDADLTPIIVASGKKLKRVLADEQNEVLDALRRGDPVTDIDDVLPDSGQHLLRYSEAIADELVAASNAGAHAATGGTVRSLRKKPREAARDAAVDVIEEWLVVPLRERLDRCVADGDGDNAVVSRRARSVYREWKTQHIDERLDDVARMAYGRGVFEGVATGTPLVWTVDGEHPACPDCDDNGLAGAVPAGDDFPTGHVFAPAHPGCRCLLLPAAR
jgi:DivIVA domain-containing protein